jgi:hypothetical protein
MDRGDNKRGQKEFGVLEVQARMMAMTSSLQPAGDIANSKKDKGEIRSTIVFFLGDGFYTRERLLHEIRLTLYRY